MADLKDLTIRRWWLTIAVAVPVAAVVACTVGIPTVQAGSSMSNATMGNVLFTLLVGVFWMALWVAFAVFWWRTGFRPETLRSAVVVMALGLFTGALAFMPYEFLLYDLGAHAVEPTFPLVAASLVAAAGVGGVSLVKRALRSRRVET